MIYFAPLTDYVVRSTFPTAALAAIADGNGYHLINKSVYTDRDYFPIELYTAAAQDFMGWRINASGERVLSYAKIRPTPFILSHIYITAYLGTNDPQNIILDLKAGADGEAYNTHVVTVNPYSLNSPYGLNTYFDFDVLPELPAITNGDNVYILIQYSANAPVTDASFSRVCCVYTL